MPLYSFEGVSPQVAPTAFIAPTATLVGDVVIEDGASVWYGAVLRGDFGRVVVRANANVQDCSVLHGPPDLVMEVGAYSTVGHGCVVHGALIGSETIIGNGAIVMDGARIGARSLIAAHSLVSAGAEIPDGVMAAGSPAVVKRTIEPGSGLAQMLDAQGVGYAALAQRHRVSVQEITN